MRLDLQDETYTQLQSPVKKTWCESLRRDTHWKCLILTLLIYGCLSAIAWCRFTTVDRVAISVHGQRYPHRPSKASPCDDGYIYMPIAFVLMLYLVYLVECWHCHTRIQLQYKVDVSTVYERVHAMREALPIVWWKAVCYHYVRRTRQVTRYRNGDTFTTTQVYYERVNSHTASSAFNFTTCGVKDVSKTLINLEKFPATKIKFTKGFSFTTQDAEREFEDQRSAFFQEHERRDDYMETREGLDLMNTNFKEHAIAFADPDNLPWYVSQVVFWVASLCLLSWPLRVLIEYKTAYVRYHVHKLFGCNYLDSTFTPGPMSRVSTMASMELEMNIRNNYSLVPSYSEALLMDCNEAALNHRDANSNVPTYNGYAPIHGANYPKNNAPQSQSLTSSLCLPRSRSQYQIIQSDSSTGSQIQNGASRCRNVLLRLPSSVRRRLRRKKGRLKGLRPHSLAEAVPLMESSPNLSPAQPRRSHSMHSTPTLRGDRSPASPAGVTLTTCSSEPQVVISSSSSSENGSVDTVNENLSDSETQTVAQIANAIEQNGGIDTGRNAENPDLSFSRESDDIRGTLASASSYRSRETDREATAINQIYPGNDLNAEPSSASQLCSFHRNNQNMDIYQDVAEQTSVKSRHASPRKMNVRRFGQEKTLGQNDCSHFRTCPHHSQLSTGDRNGQVCMQNQVSTVFSQRQDSNSKPNQSPSLSVRYTKDKTKVGHTCQCKRTKTLKSSQIRQYSAPSSEGQSLTRHQSVISRDRASTSRVQHSPRDRRTKNRSNHVCKPLTSEQQPIVMRADTVTPESPPSYESALNMAIPTSPMCVIQIGHCASGRERNLENPLGSPGLRPQNRVSPNNRTQYLDSEYSDQLPKVHSCARHSSNNNVDYSAPFSNQNVCGHNSSQLAMGSNTHQPLSMNSLASMPEPERLHLHPQVRGANTSAPRLNALVPGPASICGVQPISRTELLERRPSQNVTLEDEDLSSVQILETTL